jgi:hypothetical protein
VHAHNSGIKCHTTIDLTVQTVFTFNYVFASLELPIYGGSAYNDKFQLLVNSVNYAFLSDGKAVC